MRLLALVVAVAAVAAPAIGAAGSATSPPFVVAYSLLTRPAVVVVRADGSEQQLTHGTSADYAMQWSPDGATIAFMRVDGNHIWSYLGLVGLDGGTPHLFSGGVYDEVPRWSPDGRWLAYQTQMDDGPARPRDDATFAVYVVRADGSGKPLRIDGGSRGGSTDWIGRGGGWIWSPDSTRIVVAQPRWDNGDSQWESYTIVNVLTGKQEASLGGKAGTSIHGVDTGAAWSPSGSRLAFLNDTKTTNPATSLRIYDLRRKAVTPFAPRVSNAEAFNDGDSWTYAAAGIGWRWSPDGRRMGLVQPDPKHPRLLRLAVADLATAKLWRLPQTLSTRLVHLGYPAEEDRRPLASQWKFSHDGSYLSYYAAAARGSLPRLIVADLSRHTVRTVANSIEAVWSPVENTLASTASTPDGCRVQFITASTGSKHSVPLRVGSCQASLAWSPDGRQLALTATTGTTHQIYTVNQGSTTPTPISDAKADDVLWPTDCTSLFRAGNGWIINDATGTARFVPQPAIPEDAYTSLWRC